MKKQSKIHTVVVYQQGNNWMLSDERTEQLPYYLETKKQVREFLQERLNSRNPEMKLRIKWN